MHPYQLESLAAERIRERLVAAEAARLAREGRRAKRRPRGERSSVRAPHRDPWILELLPRTYVGPLRRILIEPFLSVAADGRSVDPVGVGDGRRLRPRGGPQLGEDVRDVHARRLGSDEELVGDLAVGAAQRYEP